MKAWFVWCKEFGEPGVCAAETVNKARYIGLESALDANYDRAKYFDFRATRAKELDDWAAKKKEPTKLYSLEYLKGLSHWERTGEA
jgi:hypothetical protein